MFSVIFSGFGCTPPQGTYLYPAPEQTEIRRVCYEIIAPRFAFAIGYLPATSLEKFEVLSADKIRAYFSSEKSVELPISSALTPSNIWFCGASVSHYPCSGNDSVDPLCRRPDPPHKKYRQ